MSASDPSIDRKRSLLADAIAACTGDRPLNYGTPKENFEKIATLWNSWSAVRTPGPIEPWEIAIYMCLMKFARLAHAPTHRDSWLDVAGYASCGADVTEAR
jgi:hypothetical protein